MSDHLGGAPAPTDLRFDDLDLDLDLGELTVTALRDTVALPEGGASGAPSSTSCGSSSCAVPHPPTQPL